MDEYETEYRLPAKVLTNRDPIFLNRLSVRELAQWLIFGGLLYLLAKLSPLPFTFNILIGGVILIFAGLFIHAPVNGLAGIEWIYIYVRYVLEKRQHHLVAPVEVELAQPPIMRATITGVPGVKVAPKLRLVHQEINKIEEEAEEKEGGLNGTRNS
jgi:hypothetical protein